MWKLGRPEARTICQAYWIPERNLNSYYENLVLFGRETQLCEELSRCVCLKHSCTLVGGGCLSLWVVLWEPANSCLATFIPMLTAQRHGRLWGLEGVCRLLAGSNSLNQRGQGWGHKLGSWQHLGTKPSGCHFPAIPPSKFHLFPQSLSNSSHAEQR